MNSKVVILFVSAFVCFTPLIAYGSPLFETVGGLSAGGLTARVSSQGAAATYFNPALLPSAKPGLSLGIMILGERIQIKVSPRNSSEVCKNGECDVPVVFGRGPESFLDSQGNVLPHPTVPTKWLEEGRSSSDTDAGLPARPRQGAGSGNHTRVYQVIGLVNQLFKEKLVLGFYAMVPMGEFTTARAFYNDEREQYFSNSLHPEMYGDRLTSTSLAVGVGSQLNEQIAVGVSLTLNLTNTASAPVYVSNLGDLNTVLLDSEIGVEASVTPHLGIRYTPRKNVELSATLHSPQSFNIDTGFQYFLSTGTEQGARLKFTHGYQPWIMGMGALLRLGRSVELSAVLTHSLWSSYLDRHSSQPGESNPEFEWNDIFSGALSATWNSGSGSLTLSGAYVPTPVPLQVGRSNYVDNNRLSTTLNYAYKTEMLGKSVVVSAFFQSHRLLEREQEKVVPTQGEEWLLWDEVPDDAVDSIIGDPIPEREGLQTNNPGFPAFSSAGWLWGGGLNVSLHY